MTRLPANLDALLRRQRLCVVDIGARGGWQRKWEQYRPWVTFIGFEPELEECERLRRSAAVNEVYIAEALYRSESEVTLYHTRDPHCSSVYRPNQSLIRRLRPGDTRLDVVRSERIRATTLDNALEDAGVPSADFIKLDTQGAELDILRGGTRTIRSVIGVEIEVEFLPLYEDQPLFADVHQFLQANDFDLMDFPRTCSVADFRAALRPRQASFFGKAASSWTAAMRAPDGTYRGARQLLYADAVYLRSIDSLMKLMTDVDQSTLLAAKTVAVCCATGYYEHALTFVNVGHEKGIIDRASADDLRFLTRALSDSLSKLVEDLKRIAGRIRHRLRHAGA